MDCSILQLAPYVVFGLHPDDELDRLMVGLVLILQAYVDLMAVRAQRPRLDPTTFATLLWAVLIAILELSLPLHHWPGLQFGLRLAMVVLHSRLSHRIARLEAATGHEGEQPCPESVAHEVADDRRRVVAFIVLIIITRRDDP